MQQKYLKTFRSISALMVCLLTIKVTASVLTGYRYYLPPNFQTDFLLGRERYFWGPYHFAFYAHLVSGPFTLIAGLVLLSDLFRTHFPKWHRTLGRIQVMLILLLLTPSGLWMAFHAAAGPVAVIGFGMLAIFTAICAFLGWRTAIKRQFVLHRRWMWRCYLALFSAVVVRVNGGIGEYAGIEAQWFYAQAAWSSWIVPLAAFEWIQRKQRIKPIQIQTLSAPVATRIGLPQRTNQVPESSPPFESIARSSDSGVVEI